MAQPLADLGIISLAPILDLHSSDNPIIGSKHRSFHSDPMICSTLATAFILGMKDSKMPATGKHFPGHGSGSLSDSHVAEVTDSRDYDTIQSHDMVPFIDNISLLQR